MATKFESWFAKNSFTLMLVCFAISGISLITFFYYERSDVQIASISRIVAFTGVSLYVIIRIVRHLVTQKIKKESSNSKSLVQ